LINGESLFYLSYGSSRAPRFFKSELTGAVNNPSRSEKEVSLATIEPDKSKSQVTTVDCWVSTDGRVVDSALSLDSVKQDYNELNSRLSADDRVKVIPNSEKKKNKPQFLAALLKVRRKLISQDENWVETRKLEKATNSKLPLETYDVRRDNLLDGNFYKFPNGVRTIYQSRKHKFNAQHYAQGSDVAAASRSSSSTDSEDEIPESQGTNMSSPSSAGFGYRTIMADMN